MVQLDLLSCSLHTVHHVQDSAAVQGCLERETLVLRLQTGEDLVDLLTGDPSVPPAFCPDRIRRPFVLVRPIL